MSAEERKVERQIAELCKKLEAMRFEEEIILYVACGGSLDAAMQEVYG